jgi:hypothetical protein
MLCSIGRVDAAPVATVMLVAGVAVALLIVLQFYCYNEALSLLRPLLTAY